MVPCCRGLRYNTKVLYDDRKKWKGGEAPGTYYSTKSRIVSLIKGGYQMLEERIDKLIDSVDTLAMVIQRLWDEKDAIRGVKAPADPPKPKTEKTPIKEEAKEETTIEVKDLEGICLDIIREAGPAKKKKTKLAIKKIIKAHGGELIADCPAENLAALKVALEGVK